MSEINLSQLNLAKELARNRVAKPCVSLIQNAYNSPEISSMCNFLDPVNGCMKDNGFTKNLGESVKCPDGKGTIIIGSEILFELIKDEPTKLSLLNLAS